MSRELSTTKTSASSSVESKTLDTQDIWAMLPRFLFKNPAGVFVDPSQLESYEAFRVAVDRLFKAGAYFQDLDYNCFSKLLYTLGPVLEYGKSDVTILRLATDIAPFEIKRQDFYRDVKIEDGKAEYLFEPVYFDSENDYDDNGNSIKERAVLNFDEFIASIWTKGVRYGIDEGTVRAFISTNKTERVIIARQLDPIPGVDASLHEMAKEIRRDDSPKVLANGRADLSQFTNRYPQIGKGVQLLKKVPRVMGTPGREVSGDLIEPAIPKDFNLNTLCGPGTGLDITKDGEFIVSLQHGFLTIENKTNQISISSRIVSHEGVSGRKTGNLQLTGEDYEEHGEVQEKSVVEGWNLTLYADVFGTLSSRGGAILLHSDLMGGSALNQEGNITIKGFSSRATIHTKKGDVLLTRAESCTIIGSRVTIEHAINCDILADEVIIEIAEGCSIAAKIIHIDSVGPRKQTEMRIFPLVPNHEGVDKQVNAIRAQMAEVAARLDRKKAEIAKLSSAAEVKSYLALASRIKNKELTLTADQQAQFKKLTASVSPTLNVLGQANGEAAQIQGIIDNYEAQIAVLMDQQKQSEDQIGCTVKAVRGQTVMRIMRFSPETDLLSLAPKDIKSKLHSPATGKIVFTGEAGEIAWRYANPSE